MGRRDTVLTAEISHDRVSLSLVAHEADGWRVIRSVSQPVLPGGSQAADANDPAILARVLRRLRKEGRIPRTRTALAVSVGPLVLQVLDMPEPMPANVRAYVENELRQYVMLSGREIVCDFWAVRSGKGVQRQLLSAAADRRRICTMVEACRAAGLTVEIVEPSVLSCARAVCERGRTGMSGAKTLIVEVGPCQLCACFVAGGSLHFARSRQIPADAAERQRLGEWLGEEVRTMMRHHDCEARDNASVWEVMIVLKDGAGPAGDVADVVGTMTGACARVVAGIQDVGSGMPAGQDGPPAADGFAVARGLAMRVLNPDGGTWPVNLLPAEIVQARSATGHLLKTANAGALVLLGVLLMPQVVTRMADGMRRTAAATRVTQKLHATPALAAESWSMDRQIAQTEQALRETRQAMQERRCADWSDALRIVGDAVPPGVCVTRMRSDESERLTVEGSAPSSEAARAFVQSLGQRQCFHSVALKRIEKRQDDGPSVRYEVDCLMKPSP